MNQECIYGVRPWVITNEQNIWFTKAKNEDTVYAIVKQEPRWVRGQWRDFVLKSVTATGKTQVSVLGQNGRVLEYRPEVNPAPTFKQEADGLHVRAMFTHRLQDNSRWPNPIVLKITNVKPAFAPPRVETSRREVRRRAQHRHAAGYALWTWASRPASKSASNTAASWAWMPATAPYPGNPVPSPR